MTQRLPGTASSDEGLDAIATQTTDLSTELEGDELEDVNDESQTTHQKASKTPEQLEYERKQAVKASLANNQKAKTAQAQAEATYNTMLNIAMKNPAYLNDLYEIDPETADSITARLPQYTGMTYLEAVAKEQAQQGSEIDEDTRVKEAVAKALADIESQKNNETVISVEEDLFDELAATHSVRSFEYKRILEEYKNIKNELGAPKNARQARLYFKEAKDILRGDENDSRPDMGSLPTLSARSGRGTSTSILPKDVETYVRNALQVNPKLTRKEALEVYAKIAGNSNI